MTLSISSVSKLLVVITGLRYNQSIVEASINCHRKFNIKHHCILYSQANSLLVLQNYSSVITVHPEVVDGRAGTLVIESFLVDVPEGNTKDETCYFVTALINCNLKSLVEVSERMAMLACPQV